MLHAPAQVIKQTADSGHTQPAVERGEELHPRLTSTMATLRSSAGPGGLPQGGPGPQDFARLHHVYGNQAVLRLINAFGPPLQTKSVNAPGDLFEQEADRVADRVMRMTAPAAISGPSLSDASRSVQRRCPCGGEGGECGPAKEEKKEEKREGGLQRSPVGPARVAAAPPIVHEVLRDPGRPLGTPTLDFMEPRFGRDFSRVRVHADSRAAESARSVNAEQRAIEVEAQACVSKDEQGALEKLDNLDTRDLLNVVDKLFDNWAAGAPGCHAWGLLNSDLFLTPPTAETKEATKNVDVSRLKAAFDAARVHKQRNPVGKDLGTKPTHAGARDLSKADKPARPGDWGEDAADNTWVMHEEGIRTYWKSSVEKKARSSQWLGKNVGNFGYNRGVSKRAIASFRWGPTDFRAIYLREEDSVADIRDNKDKYNTVGEYIDKGHLGPGDDRPTYYKNIKTRVPDLKLEDPPAAWVNDDKKWNRLAAGFKLAEGWTEGTTVKANNVETGAKPEDATLVAYYRTLLGVAAPTPAANPAAPNPATPGSQNPSGG